MILAKRGKTTLVWYTGMAFVSLWGLSFPAIDADAMTFKNEKYGYTLQYPADWTLQVTGDVFCIENFPPSKAVRAVRLPPGGASIIVVVPEQFVRRGQSVPRNMDEWVTLATAKRKVLVRRELEVGNGAEKLAVTELRTQCCAVPPYQESIDWYFTVEGRMLSASLLYWQGDPNADNLKSKLRQVVLGLRVSRPGSKRFETQKLQAPAMRR